MKASVARVVFGLILAALGVAVAAHAQAPSAENLARRAIERRAVDVVNWGMPAVNDDLMLQEMLSRTEGRRLADIERILTEKAGAMQ